MQTSTVSDYSTHPIKRFLDLGVITNLNTDDPGISAIDIGYEYDVAAVKAGLTPEQIIQSQYNALDMAFLTPEKKDALRQRKVGL